MNGTIFLSLFLLLFGSSAIAGEAKSVGDGPALEARAYALESELRCLVCQNQTLADSSAPLAMDLRQQIREQLRAGASDRDIIDFMVARYGDFVLYRPPLKATTVLLWAGPALLMLAGLVVLYRRLARRREEAPAELTDAQRERARALLDGARDGEPR